MISLVHKAVNLRAFTQEFGENFASFYGIKCVLDVDLHQDRDFINISVVHTVYEVSGRMCSSFAAAGRADTELVWLEGVAGLTNNQSGTKPGGQSTIYTANRNWTDTAILFGKGDEGGAIKCIAGIIGNGSPQNHVDE